MFHREINPLVSKLSSKYQSLASRHIFTIIYLMNCLIVNPRIFLNNNDNAAEVDSSVEGTIV